MNEEKNKNNVNSLFQIRKLFSVMVKGMNESTTKKLNVNLLNNETLFGDLICFGFNNSNDNYTVTINTTNGEKVIDFKDVESTKWEN